MTARINKKTIQRIVAPIGKIGIRFPLSHDVVGSTLMVVISLGNFISMYVVDTIFLSWLRICRPQECIES